MKWIIGIIIGVVLVIFYSCFALSGRISREEEKQEELRKQSMQSNNTK